MAVRALTTAAFVDLDGLDEVHITMDEANAACAVFLRSWATGWTGKKSGRCWHPATREEAFDGS